MMTIALGLKAFGYTSPNVICFLPIEGKREWIQYPLKAETGGKKIRRINPLN